MVAYPPPQYIEKSRGKAGDEQDLSPVSYEVRDQHHNRGAYHPKDVLNFSRQSAITDSNQLQDIHIVAHKKTGSGRTRAETKECKERQTVRKTRWYAKTKLKQKKGKVVKW